MEPNRYPLSRAKQRVQAAAEARRIAREDPGFDAWREKAAEKDKQAVELFLQTATDNCQAEGGVIGDEQGVILRCMVYGVR